MNGRKVLVLLNGDSASQKCVSFAVRLFNDMKVSVVVGFIPGENKKHINGNRARIKQALLDEYNASPHVRLLLRNGDDFTLEEIARESHYADLIVLQAALLNDPTNNWDDAFTSSGLASPVHVPVIVVPEEAEVVDEVLVTYDGRKASFSAIKQFCQIMSNLCERVQVTLLEINHNSSQFLPEEERLLVEYLTEHCSNIGIYKVADESPEKIMKIIDSGKKAIVVAGTLEALKASLEQLPEMGNRLMRENNLAGFYGVAE